MQAVILAAGKGSRLHPLTLNRSKAMLPIAGKPMIARVMEMLKFAGLQEFIIVAHPEDRELRNFFAPSQNIKIVLQSERKGAAHALSYAAPFIKSDFVLSACDNLVNPAEAASFVQHFQPHPARKALGLLALLRVPKEKMNSMGMVDWDGSNIRRIIEKPSPSFSTSDLASLPLYCFSHRFLDYLPRIKPSIRGEFELQDAMQMLIDETGALEGQLLSGRLTVTNASDLLELNLHFLTQEFPSPPASLPPGVRFISPFLLEPGAQVAPGCLIGPNVLIESGSSIGSGAILRNALVLRGAAFPAGATLENRIIS
jgi:dTDP-glucose pyrophosphorylase